MVTGTLRAQQPPLAHWPGLSDCTWLVDRMHFKGHSPNHVTCAQLCNPYALGNAGLVNIISKTQINQALAIGIPANDERFSRIGLKYTTTVSRMVAYG